MKPKVIVTAHDFGLSSAVNNGIKYCLNQENSIISELSLLPNTPGSIEAAQMAKDISTSVSLNVNLTTFKPLANNVPSLINKNGDFRKVTIQDWDFSSIDHFSEEDVRKEIDTQWDWFVENVGRKPTALLARKNEHGDPKILLPFVEKAKKENVPIRVPAWRWHSNYGAQSYVAQEGIKQSNYVETGIKDWTGKNGYDISIDFEKLLQKMKNREGITELILFIGFVDQETFDSSVVNWQRGQFLSMVINKDPLLERMQEEFEIISYRNL